MIYVFLADGFEETEAICPLDILRRAGLEVYTVSVSGRKSVLSSRKIPVEADLLLEELTEKTPEGVVLPGGMPGAKNLNIPAVRKTVQACADAGGVVGAICAAPFILGEMGLLRGRNATCYPGFENSLEGATYRKEPAVEDGNLVTAIGMGASVRFGLALVRLLKDGETAERIALSIFA